MDNLIKIKLSNKQKLNNFFNKIRQRKVKPICELEYELDVYFHYKPNAVTPYGMYYFSIHDFQQGICELTPRQKREANSIWYQRRLAHDEMRRNMIKFGPQYSSDNSGDGPPLYWGKIYIHDEEKIKFLIEYFQIPFGHITIVHEAIIEYTYVENTKMLIIYPTQDFHDLLLQLGCPISSMFQLQSGDEQKFEYMPYMSCALWFSVIFDNMDLIKQKIQDKSVYDTLEKIAFLLYDLSKASSMKDVAFAIGRATHGMLEGKLLEQTVITLKNAIEIIFQADLQSNDESLFFDKIRDLLDNYVIIKDSPLVKKLYKFVMYIITYFLFKDPDCTYDTFGYTKLEAEILKKQYSSKSDFVYTLLDTITFICEKGYQIYKDGYTSSIFHSSNKYIEFNKRCSALIERAALLNQTEALDENAFLAELDDLLEKGNDILKVSKHLNKFDVSVISRYTARLQSIKLDILTFKGATKARKSPFGILLFGNSGIGKTSLVRVLIKQFCLVNDLEDADEYIYFRNFSEEFWNNFRTCMHTVVLDDVSNEHPNLGDPKSVNDIISVMNDANCVPNQASLEDKGRVPLRCKLAIATTNVKNLNAHAYFSCPSAVQRRFPYIVTPTVKPKYVDPTTGMLDPSRVPDVPENSFDDLWYFKIEKVQTRPIDINKTIQSLATFELVADKLEMREFIVWYTNAIHDFNKNQNVVTNAVANIRKTKACQTCKLPLDYCHCDIQSAEIELLKFAWFYGIFSIFTEFFSALTLLILPYLGFTRWKFSAVEYMMRRPRLAQMYFSKLGNKVCEKYGRPKYLLRIAGAMGTVFAVYKLYEVTKKKVQGNNQSKDNGYKPQPSKYDTRDAIWYKDTYELTTFDVSKTTLSSKGNIDLIKRIISKNCVFIRSDVNETTTRPTKAFCIGGQLYIANNHAIPKLNKINIELIQQCSKDGVTSNIQFTLCENDIFRIPDKDLCCFVVRCLPPKKNLTQYFCKETFRANTHAFYLGRREDGSMLDMNVENIKQIKELTPALLTTIGKIPYMTKWVGVAETPTVNGDCGSVLISKSELGYCIVGLHMQGDGNNVASTAVDTQIISIFIDKFSKYFYDSNPPLLQADNHTTELASLHKKSCLRFVENGSSNTFGSFIGFRSSNKSRVEPTLMNEKVKKYGYKEKYGPPIFDWRPWRLGALDSLNIPNIIDTEILDKCVKTFTKDILSTLGKEELTNLHIFDDFTTINGAAGVNYVDKIARNTSAGFPFRKSKKHFMFSVEPQHDLQDPVDVTPEIKNLYHQMLDRYKNGEIAAAVFTAHLKDEPVSFKKIETGKTRVFSGANLPWTMVVRKYLLSVVRVIQENRYVFEAAPGIVAQSSEWDELYHYLTHFGTHKIIAGDYGKYDKKMSSVMILGAFDVIHDICEASGNYTSQDLQVIRGIGYDTAFSFQDYNGDLIQFFGSNPSGHPLTVIINCLVNSLYMRYTYFLSNPDKECESFKENVNLMTYGDDNIMGVSDRVPWFNHTAISRSLENIKVTYTMADKEAESVPYIDISEASFLKRSWRYDDATNTYLAPLDHDSIEKMLLTWVRSKTITPEEQAIAVIESANREYFFYGKEKYIEKQSMFKKIIQECDLSRFVEKSTLPSYEDLISEYLRRSGEYNII